MRPTYVKEALEAELRDSIHLEAALRFYAGGGNDGGERAREALASLPSDVHILELLESETVSV